VDNPPLPAYTSEYRSLGAGVVVVVVGATLVEIVAGGSVVRVAAVDGAAAVVVTPVPDGGSVVVPSTSVDEEGETVGEESIVSDALHPAATDATTITAMT
jgi:hypothetical protein